MRCELIVARHGETDWNAQRRLQGHLDVPLNELGRAQAVALATRLGATISQRPGPPVFSSDLLRARETAARLAAALESPLRTCADLRERGLGDAEGLTLHELSARPGIDSLHAYVEHLDVGTVPGCERVSDFRARVVRGLQWAAGETGSGLGIVVTHGGAVRVMLRAAGLTEPLDLGNTDAVRFQISGGEMKFLGRWE